MEGRAVLRFAGAAELVCEKLPQTFVLDPAQRREVVVGREVPPGGFLLDSGMQKLMISRQHAKLVLVDEGRWKVEDLQSTNGILYNGVRVSEAVLAHGDTITFGGARSTAMGRVPGPKSTESIYSFSFETMAPCDAGTASESLPSTRSRSKSSKSPAGDRIGSASAGASAATSPEGRREWAAAPCDLQATRAASKGKGKEPEEPATTEAGTAAGADDCEHATRPIARRRMSPAGAMAGTSTRRARLPHLLSAALRAPTLPLQNLRDEDGRLDHRLLGPEEAWPTSDNSCAVSLEGEDGAPGLHVGQLSFTVTDLPRGVCFNCNKKMRVEFERRWNAWSPDASTPARLLFIFYSDDGPEKEAIAVVEARGGEHQKFWTLFQLALLNQPAPADPKSQHIWEEGDLPFQDKKSKSMPRVLLRASMARGVSADAMPTVTLNVALGPAAFLLDRRISAGATHGNWITEEEYENALVGERPVGAQDAFKALRRLLLHMASLEQATGLRLGPDTCEDTLNGYAGVRKADVVDKEPPEASGRGGSSKPPSTKPVAKDFDLGRLLESISTKGGDAPPGVAAEALGGLRAEALSGLREDCNLYAFQQDGIAWMASAEERGDCLSLHPSWIQFKTRTGAYIYQHKWTGELSARFFTAPRQETCGGMLCDDVGLGKTVQLLGLVMARRPPLDFAVQELPSHTNRVLPIKGTLIVAPEALLPQWESEIRKHTKPGALKACTYLGIGKGRKKEAAAAAAAREPGRGARARSAHLQVEPSAESEEETGPRVTRQSVRAADANTSAPRASAPRFEVLARTQRHLFERAATTLEDDDSNEDEVEVEKCDVILCSFETLRDELRKTQRTHGGMDLPLGALGFWRVILDEAQLVSQSTSRAAVVCSDLWRRHAWVATGTPINAKIDELHGLLAFLGAAPFHNDSTFHRLLLQPYKERESSALYKMRTLLRALCLRRSKKDPIIASQIAIPPLRWETRLLTFSDTERAVYACAAEQLRRSHAAFRRASAPRASNSRARARLLGQLNGDLTRYRESARARCSVRTASAGR